MSCEKPYPICGSRIALYLRISFVKPFSAFFSGLALTTAVHGVDAAAIDFSYTNIADTQGPFIFFQPPVINNLGQVASVGQQDFGLGQGLLFRGQGGALVPIADDTKLGTAIGRFAMNDSGAVAFESFFSNPGLYVSSGGPPVTIASPASGYSNFGKPAINNAGLVAAPAVGGPGGESIIAGTGAACRHSRTQVGTSTPSLS